MAISVKESMPSLRLGPLVDTLPPRVVPSTREPHRVVHRSLAATGIDFRGAARAVTTIDLASRAPQPASCLPHHAPRTHDPLPLHAAR